MTYRISLRILTSRVAAGFGAILFGAFAASGA